MQTFLPVKDFKTSAKILDYRRLGKQRIEAKQILNALDSLSKGKKAGWTSHPAVLMWKGFETALCYYHDMMVLEWISRGYKNSMKLFNVFEKTIKFPFWLGDQRLHASHRSNLLRKDYDYYQKYNWSENTLIPYFWPIKK